MIERHPCRPGALDRELLTEDFGYLLPTSLPFVATHVSVRRGPNDSTLLTAYADELVVHDLVVEWRPLKPPHTTGSLLELHIGPVGLARVLCPLQVRLRELLAAGLEAGGIGDDAIIARIEAAAFAADSAGFSAAASATALLRTLDVRRDTHDA